MSGTSYGAVVLHVAPESAVGGPLALVRTGDRIRLDVEARALDVLVDDAELARRRAAWTPPARKDERGYRRLYERPRPAGQRGLRPRLPARPLAGRHRRRDVSLVVGPGAQKAAAAASATAVSCSPSPPLTPTAPTTSPSRLSGMPPAKIITRPLLDSWMP